MWQSETVVRKLTIAYCLAALLVPTSASSEVDRAAQLKAYIQMAAVSLEAPQRSALAQIKDEDKRNLAMTFYLRAGADISSRWGWTDEQIRTYRKSAAHAAALGEIDKIRRSFANANPGYVLYANTQIRSLEDQLARWQAVPSIGVAATQLRSDVLAQLTKHAYPLDPDEMSSKRFVTFLIAWRASPAPTLAAPGLSLHGRGRAYDFQIRDLKGRTIAGADSATIQKVWDGEGWTNKLSSAVHAASDKFVGPLATLNEPWHYEYRPGTN